MRGDTTYDIIWQTIRLIPRGKVSTYGAIARLAGLLGQARQVGYALRATPPGTKVPWHRVINAQGKISFPKSSARYARQKTLLLKERVEFRREKVDLTKYLWQP